MVDVLGCLATMVALRVVIAALVDGLVNIAIGQCLQGVCDLNV